MVQAIIFGIAIFIGWIVMDVTKEKRLRKEKAAESLIAGIVGGMGWFLLDLLFT
ncbi:hypothetical protein [Alteribacillus sp. HJP-4]|uniref:hypothetical protein n=1 Tax=Alteribacillus sp. HJP-4 TaxID=2775394 RepID=UPI0035CD1350